MRSQESGLLMRQRELIRAERRLRRELAERVLDGGDTARLHTELQGVGRDLVETELALSVLSERTA